MDTLVNAENLSSALFGKTRRAVLGLLYSRTDEAFYLRHIERLAGVGLGPLQRELKQLTNAGILNRSMRGQNVYYQANPDCPIFDELKNLVIKTVGVGDVIRTAFLQLNESINIVLLYGSIARGEERRESDVDILVVGNVTFAEIASILSPIQQQLDREINPTVYSVGEFKNKLLGENHFLKSVLNGPKIFLIGDEDELTRLG